MRTRTVSIGLLTAVLATCLTTPSLHANGSMPVAQLTDAAVELLSRRVSALVQGSPAVHQPSDITAGVRVSPAVRLSEATAYSALRGKREFLEDKGIRYASRQMTVTDHEMRVIGTRATLRLSLLTRLRFADATAAPFTEYRSERTFTFHRVGRGWAVTGLQLTGELGLLPPDEPARGGGAVTTPQQEDGPNPFASEEPLIFDGPPGARAQDVRTTEGFDWRAAVAYARQYAINPNPAYYEWKNIQGGDCTNFISQALFAGGWTYVEPPIKSPVSRRNPAFWYYERDDASTSAWSWPGANMWATFAKYSGRAEKVKYLSEVQLGDIVQYADPEERTKAHTMIVTATSGDGPMLSYHTGNTLDESLWRIYNDHRGMSFYAWRIVKST